MDNRFEIFGTLRAFTDEEIEAHGKMMERLSTDTGVNVLSDSTCLGIGLVDGEYIAAMVRAVAADIIDIQDSPKYILDSVPGCEEEE